MVGTLRRGCEGGKEIPGRAGRLAVGGGLFCHILCKVFPDSLGYFSANTFKAGFFVSCCAGSLHDDNFLIFGSIFNNKAIFVFHI